MSETRPVQPTDADLRRRTGMSGTHHLSAGRWKIRTTIRPVRMDDDPFLFELYATTRADEMAAGGWGPEAVATFLKVQHAAQNQHYTRHFPNARHSIIEVQGQPVGRLYLHGSGDVLRLVDIALLPEHRGKGIGTAIIKEMLSRARSTRRRVQLSVAKNNPARRLYERLGFRVTGESDLHVNMEANSRPFDQAPAGA